MPPLDLYFLTFNCARHLIDPSTFAPHVFDAYPHDGRIPDIVAVYLQEIAPISYSFLGGTYLTDYYDRVRTSVSLATKGQVQIPNAYRNVATRNIGMTAIMLFAKPEVATRIVSLQTAEVGLGMWEMGNKGAVGTHISYAQENNGQVLDFTFIAAHLAPMEHAVQKRNEDWEAIVRNLVFEDEQSSNGSQSSRARGQDEAEPLLSSNSPGQEPLSNLYRPKSYVFFGGDLNYRTSDHPALPRDHKNFPQSNKPDDDPRHYSHLLKRDQLQRELKDGRTLHGFQEMPIGFGPTYKYSNRRLIPSAERRPHEHANEEATWEWAKHRWPSWCDRILYLPAPGGSPHLTPHKYTSLPVQPTSDHQPVALSVSVDLGSIVATDRNLQIGPLFPINPNRRMQRASARNKEIAVGIAAFMALTTKGLGMSAATIATVLAAVYFFGWLV